MTILELAKEAVDYYKKCYPGWSPSDVADAYTLHLQKQRAPQAAINVFNKEFDKRIEEFHKTLNQ